MDLAELETAPKERNIDPKKAQSKVKAKMIDGPRKHKSSYLEANMKELLEKLNELDRTDETTDPKSQK